MERKLKTCKRCKKERLIWARGMCKKCYIKTKIENDTLKPIKRTSIQIKPKEATGEKILLDTLISTRKHISYISELEIKPISYCNCAHVLAKGLNKYPKFKLYDKNIVFLTMKEHHLYDNGTADQREQYARDLWEIDKIIVRWDKLYALRDILIEEYKELSNRDNKQ